MVMEADLGIVDVAPLAKHSREKVISETIYMYVYNTCLYISYINHCYIYICIYIYTYMYHIEV